MVHRRQISDYDAQGVAWLRCCFLIGVIVGYAWWHAAQAQSALETASIEELRALVARQPNDARAFYYLGIGLERKRQTAAAFDALARATRLDQDDEQLWREAAGTANGLQGPPAAFQLMDDFLKRHPNSQKMKEERASLLDSLQRASEGFASKQHYTEAIRFYKIWLAEDPKSVTAQQGLAQALAAQGKKNTKK